jgi:hypothetical protein
MSEIASVVERTRKAFATVSALEGAVARAPEDRALRLNLSAMRKMALQAEQQLMSYSARQQVEVCNYRLLPEAAENFGLPFVSESMLQYQNLFSQIYDAIKHGPKSVASIKRDAFNESLLEFGYSYSGSLGIVLLRPGSRDFFTGQFDASIEALFQALDIKDQHDVRDIANSLGLAVVKRIHDWSEANYKGGFSADVRWNRSDGRQLGQVVERRQMASIISIIKTTSDKEIVERRVYGLLVGINLKAGTFHFVVPDGPDYRGILSPEFSRSQVVPVGRAYWARIDETKVTHYATDRVETSHALKVLEAAPPTVSAPGPDAAE